ncbi:hypothetical protein [Desulfobotulus mexicanus]|uniref:Flagellar protein FliL n=1 Tax=Desulfobotulus mexicanus TaxID=2586642 RepID=A0A5S5MDZ2_9BACT|nr:hypothetical protein [Desulfobotulus mexicanus]TYT73900.1 hypothetical protein FIM25_12740 [Desulfobotulus mexicanus]
MFRPLINNKLLWMILFFFLLSGCDKLAFLIGEAPYKYSFSYMGAVEDGSYVRAEITLGFSDQEGVLESHRQRERMRYAMDLIIRPYTSRQMDDKGKRMRKIAKRVADNILTTPVRSITITDFEVVYREGTAPTQEELDSQRQSIFPRTFHGE